MTEKLYLNDSLALDFEANVLQLTTWQDRPAVVLDRSAFYGEAGGQMADLGQLRAGDRVWEVVDCQYDEADTLYHVLANSDQLPAAGTALHGQVQFARRRDMMSQHSGQHLLSAAFVNLFEAETQSSRLGSALSTLDLAVADLSDSQVEQALALVNQLILENRPMRVHYPDAAGLRAMALRRAPKVETDIRVVEIEGFDFTPCGGTHCRATGEIGPVVMTTRERYKGNVRINFLCGDRVLQRLAKLEAERFDLGELLGCGAAGVGEAVNKQVREIKDLQRRLGATRGALVQLEAEQILRENPPGGEPCLLRLVRADEDFDYLKSLAAALARRADVRVLAAARDAEGGGWRLSLDAGSEAGFDAGGWFRREAKLLGGRGGGRPNHAEGVFPGDLDPLTLSLD